MLRSPIEFQRFTAPSTWTVQTVLNLGQLARGATSDVTEFRLRNTGGERRNCGLVISGDGYDGAAAVREILAWGDAGAGLQVQQRNGPGGSSWGDWTTIKTGTGDTPDNRILLDPFTIAAESGVIGVIPVGTITRSFRTRLIIPSDGLPSAVRAALRAYYDRG